MKVQNRSLSAIGAFVSLSAIAALSLQAQVTNLVTLSLSAVGQAGSTDSGTITTTAAPIKKSVTTKQILIWLAQDENAENNYSSTNFPTGAKLVAVGNNANSSGPDFAVLDKNNNLLVDVSDILTGNSGNNDIFSGKQSDTTGLAQPSTADVGIFSLTFDDTAITGGVGLQFYIQGTMSSTTKDSVPVNGVATEAQTHKMTNGAGEGSYQGVPFVVTGSLNAAGKGTISVLVAQ